MFKVKWRNSIVSVGKAGAIFAGFLVAFLLPTGSQAQLGTPPIIGVQPLDQTVPSGGSAVFTVVAASVTTMTYQWRAHGTNIPGATASIYTRANIQYPDSGAYSVIITNASGWTRSSNAILTVLNIPLRFSRAGWDTNGFSARLEGPILANYVVYRSTN